MPEWIAKCLETHIVAGYEHRFITLDNCYHNKYIDECLEAERYAKAVDYLRMHYLNEEGGIYLDCDVKVVKPFDDVLDNAMFCGQEKNGFISNAIIGAEAGHPILEKYLKTVTDNFIGSGDLVYQPGMYLFTELVTYNPVSAVTVYPPDWFLPYDWQTDVMETSNNTHTIHYFNKSWK